MNPPRRWIARSLVAAALLGPLVLPDAARGADGWNRSAWKEWIWTGGGWRWSWQRPLCLPESFFAKRPHDRGLRIVHPRHRRALGDVPTLEIEVRARGRFAPVAFAPPRLKAELLVGIDEHPVKVDVTDRLVVEGRVARAEISAETELVEGRSRLRVTWDRDGDGCTDRLAETTFSYEPELVRASAHGCDPLDPSLCLYPFPNDHFTTRDRTMDTGRRIAFRPESMPVNQVGDGVDPTEWNRNDGFSPGQALHVILPGLSLETPPAVEGGRPEPAPGIAREWDVGRSLQPDAAILLIDRKTGERIPYWAELDVNARDDAGRALLVRPAKNLRSGGRYLVALRGLRDAEGELLAPGRAFRAYRDGVPTYVRAVERRRRAMNRIFRKLRRHGVKRHDLQLAWEFTVQSQRNLSERMVHIRDDAFERLGDAAPAFEVTEVVDGFGEEGDLRAIFGHYDVPLYVTQDGLPGGVDAATRLRCEDVDGRERFCEGAELPVAGGTFRAPFRCTVSGPEADHPLPARLILFGHGLFDDEGEVGRNRLGKMIREHGFAYCATRTIGMTREDVFETVLPAVVDLSRFATIPDRMHQGLLNHLFLGRLMLHPEGLASHPAFQDGAGASRLDRTELYYEGISQGAIVGAALLAFSQDVRRGHLSLPGMNFSTLMHRSINFPLFFGFLDLSYPDRREHPLLMALAQMLWDRTEANGHVNHLTRDPHPGTPPKTLLLQGDWGDQEVANNTMEAQARSLRIPMHRPAFDPAAFIDRNPRGEPRAYFPDDPFWGIPGIPEGAPVGAVPPLADARYGYDGSALIVFDSGALQSPQSNVPPPLTTNPESGECAVFRDGNVHGCSLLQKEGRLQRSEFFRPDGLIWDVCGDAPCFAHGVE